MENCQSNEIRELINTLYSLNYSCLSSTNYIEPTVQIIRSEDVFKKHNVSGGIKSYIENKNKEKIKKIAEIKNNFFENVFETLKEESGNISIIKNKMESLKKEIADIYNLEFHDNKKPEQLIDGFNIIDKRLSSLMSAFYYDNSQNCVAFKHSTIELLSSYSAYTTLLGTYMDLQTISEIAKNLRKDVSQNGYKNLDFGISSSDSLMSLTQEDIKKLSTRANGYLSDIDKEIKTANINLIRNKRQQKKKNSKNSNELFEENSRLVFELHNLNNERNVIQDLVNFVKVFEDRFKAANTDYIYSKNSVKLLGKVYDFLTGITFIKNNKPVNVDSIYIHKLEINYYRYLLNKVLEIKANKEKEKKLQESGKQPE